MNDQNDAMMKNGLLIFPVQLEPKTSTQDAIDIFQLLPSRFSNRQISYAPF